MTMHTPSVVSTRRPRNSPTRKRNGFQSLSTHFQTILIRGQVHWLMSLRSTLISRSIKTNQFPVASKKNRRSSTAFWSRRNSSTRRSSKKFRGTSSARSRCHTVEISSESTWTKKCRKQTAQGSHRQMKMTRRCAKMQGHHICRKVKG